jgi:hypothetical protein
MALDTITGLTQAVIDWSNAGLTTTQASDLITLGENRVYRELRVRQMEATTTIAITNGSAPIPSDYIEIKNVHLSNSPSRALKRTTVDRIYQDYPQRSATGEPQYIARDGSNFVFGPNAGSGYSIVLNYYAKPSTVVGTTLTGITLSSPELLLFSALCEAEPFLGRDGRTQLYEQKYQYVKTQVEKQSKWEDFSGSTLEVRPS